MGRNISASGPKYDIIRSFSAVLLSYEIAEYVGLRNFGN